MNEQQLSLFIAWLESQIIEVKIAMSYTDDDLQRQFWKGQLEALELVYKKIQTV